MQAKDQNRYRMFISVRGTLTEHETDNTWTGIPALVTAVDELDAVVSGIALQLETTTLPSGAAASKKTALESLVIYAHEIAAAIHAYATEGGDDELAAEVDFSPSDLAQGRPATIVARCTNIASLATENLALLADYKITQAKVTALTKKTAAFEKLASKPRQGVAKKAAANAALPRLLKQGRNILTRRVDKLMVQFRESAPEFYNEYKSARKIVGQHGAQNERKSPDIFPAAKTGELPKAA